VCRVIDSITILPEMIRNTCNDECQISPTDLIMAYIDSNMDAADAVADAMTEFMKTDAGKDLLELHADVANAKRAHNYEDSDSYTGDYNGEQHK